ncbi:hypothetical protein VNO77_11689 [Canavalia gladiata]|uniref:Uncharacterized protein n=1 Tax=Canavalia gladiata TaxID=3824 RepID=A0AAN9R2S7_CANGL
MVSAIRFCICCSVNLYYFHCKFIVISNTPYVPVASIFLKIPMLTLQGHQSLNVKSARNRAGRFAYAHHFV